MTFSNLRSPYEKVTNVCYFPRMLDKIRLHLHGELPADYQPNLGGGFDARCVSFLGVAYEALVERVRAGGSDEEILEWCFTHGRRPSTEEIEIWNEYMRKRGLRDSGTAMLRKRLLDGGFDNRPELETFFDFIDADEGRPLRPWSAD